ncbi:sugar ABC transporter permease, partial [Paenibacillus sepulcri]|nr:sugar ABC transporter permease [Paenibacillus sepulcri]
MTKVLRLLQYQIFLLPILLVYTLFTIYPLIRSLILSFTDFDGYDKNYAFTGLKNYMKLFTDDAIVSGISFTLLFALLSTLLITILAIPLALILDQKFMTRNLHRAIFFFPSIPSGLLLAFIWGFILSPVPSGVLNTVLREVFHA